MVGTKDVTLEASSDDSFLRRKRLESEAMFESSQQRQQASNLPRAICMNFPSPIYANTVLAPPDHQRRQQEVYGGITMDCRHHEVYN
jgi:hypothetical protein